MKCFGRRHLSKHVKIILLDDQEIIQEVQRLTTGQELLDTVFKHLNIIETSYFGLRFIDNAGQTHWLDPGKYVVKQLNGTDPANFYFGVKFYAADPCKLFEEITRYQFFLQIKKDILQGRLNVSTELAAQLGAHAIQSELGDYDPKRHVNGYVSEFRFVANQSVELEEQISNLHKAMAGDVPAVAELNYLEKVKWLDMYGVDLHPVLGEDKIDYFLGLTPSGIIVLRNKNKVGNYFWPRISKISMKGKYFMIRVKNRAQEEETYGFETPSKAACKHLWKCAMDHHTFFRLVQVTPTPNTNNKVLTLNNRFRDSNHSNMSSASRRRAQPQFIRTPSRRYTRRYVEGSEMIGNSHQEYNAASLGTQLVEPGAPPNKSAAVDNWKMSNSPKSIRSVPLHPQNHTSYSVPSPRSQRSPRKRSKSIESNSSCEEGSHRRHHHHHSNRRKHRHSHSSSRPKQSDGESEVSGASRSSSKKRYRHKSRHYENSGSESENQHHHRRHRRRQRSNSSEVIEWKEATMSTVQQSVSCVKTLGGELEGEGRRGVEFTGNSGGKAANKSAGPAHNNQRSSHRHQSRRSSLDRREGGNEIKKYFQYELVDTDGMSREELNSLPYTSVRTSQDPALSMKSRVLMKHQQQHSRSKYSSNSNVGSASLSHHQNQFKDDDHPPLSSLPQLPPHSMKSTTEVTLNKMCGTKGGGGTGENSPPPPYSPPANEQLHFSLAPQTPAGQQSVGGIRTPFKFQSKEPEPAWSSSLTRKKYGGRSSKVEMYDAVSGTTTNATANSLTTRQPESPGKDHLENSDSGLGTDREYYSLTNNMAAPQRPTGSYSQQQHHNQQQQQQVHYWNERTAGGESWTLQRNSHGNPSIQDGQRPGLNENLNQENRSSSLEMILSPLVSSTTTNRTRL